MKKILAIAIISLATSTAFAQSNEKFYIGGSLGSVKSDTEVSGLTGTASLDEKDTGYKIYFGYKVNETFSTEFQYADFGKAELKGNNGDRFIADGRELQFTANNASISGKTKSFGASILAGTNITESIRPFAKVGLHRWDQKTTTSAAGVGGTSESDDGVDVFYGVGLDVKIVKNVFGRVEVERYKIDSNYGDFISAGIRVAF
jgi:OOP family OmpA-OmpF porin